MNRDGQVGNSTFNGANHLTADADFTYVYDSNGATASRTAAATGEVTEYAWDAENQLVQIQEKPDTTSSAGSYSASTVGSPRQPDSTFFAPLDGTLLI